MGYDFLDDEIKYFENWKFELYKDINTKKLVEQSQTIFN